MQTLDQAIALVPKMSISDRLRLAEVIWDSLADVDASTLTPEQQSELGERMAAHDANPASALTREEVERRVSQLR